MGDFTFWLSPWFSLLAEPKTRLSRRWAKMWRLSRGLVRTFGSAWAQSKVRTVLRLRPNLIWTYRL